MGDKGKQFGFILNGGSFSGGNFSNRGAISGEINAPITVNHYYENAKNPGNRTEGEYGSIQNQETFSGKACQRIQLKSTIL